MENGSVDIVLVGKRLTIVLFHKLDTSLHQLAPSAPGYDKASEDFITTVVEKFIDHFNCNAVHSAFIASPDSNLKKKFLHRLWSEASARQLSSISKYIKIFDVNSSTGQKMSLREVLESVMTYIDNTELAKEIKALESFWTMLRKDRHSACFGPTHVEAAHNVKAVKTLLISNDVLRGEDVATRQKYVTLVDEVKKCGGIVHVFSHIAEEELKLLAAGVAAILNTPLNLLDDIEMCPK